jgi:cell division protein FtsW
MIQFFKRFSTNGISGVKGGIKEGFEDFRLGLRDATTVVRPTRSRMMEYDQPLLWAVLILVTLGLVMVYSASIALPDGPKYAKYSSSHFLIRHAISIMIAFTVGVLAFKVPLKVWDRLAPTIFALAFIMLIFVLIPGVGKGVNGAKRWISLGITN